MIVFTFVVLLLFQLTGELLSNGFHLPVPGPVIGMLLLTLWYLIRQKEPDKPMTQLSQGLLGWLGLLFVPAGVGVVTQIQLLRTAWFPLLAALVLSTMATLLLTAGTMHWFARGTSR